MRVFIELDYDADLLTAAQKIDLEFIFRDNATAIGTAMGAALATEINTTLGLTPTMPTVTATAVTLDPQTSTRATQVVRPSRDY